VRTVAEEYDRVVGVDTLAATHTMTLLIAARLVPWSSSAPSRPAWPGYVEFSPGSLTAPRTGPVWSSSRAPAPTERD
jgi:hypothetical protein